MRERWRTRFGRSMARPRDDGPHLPEPGPRGRVILGWIGAAVVIAVVAFIVGRPPADAGDAIVGSPVPSPTAAPLPITFGTALDPSSLLALHPTGTFRSGDAFAYSVDLGAPVGTDTVYVHVDRVDGTVETVQDWAEGDQLVDAALTAIAFQVPAANLADAFGPGTYEMQISLDEGGRPLLATGSFRLVDEPAAS